MTVEPVAWDGGGGTHVRGFAHWPDSGADRALVLTHGAGAHCRTPWLIALAEAFAGGGHAVLRCDLPFRQARPLGPPRPADAVRDRQGLADARRWFLERGIRRVWMGGHSYGGRQASMLAAEDPGVLHGLLLSSYPLHPPGKPAQLRSRHLPDLRIPVLIVQGERDTFGTPAEVEEAFRTAPAAWRVLPVPAAGHDLRAKGGYSGLADQVLRAFTEVFPEAR